MEPVSTVSICNLALDYLGAGTISNIDEESSEALCCKRHFDIARRGLLRSFDWPFARKYSTLALIGNEDDHPLWTYKYQYPTDCIRALKIISEEASSPNLQFIPENERLRPNIEIPFEVEQSPDGKRKYVLTNQESPILRYTTDVTTCSLFDDKFVRTLALILAMEISTKITGSAEINKTLNVLFSMEFGTSRKLWANEEKNNQKFSSNLVRSRG